MPIIFLLLLCPLTLCPPMGKWADVAWRSLNLPTGTLPNCTLPTEKQMRLIPYFAKSVEMGKVPIRICTLVICPVYTLPTRWQVLFSFAYWYFDNWMAICCILPTWKHVFFPSITIICPPKLPYGTVCDCSNSFDHCATLLSTQIIGMHETSVKCTPLLNLFKCNLQNAAMESHSLAWWNSVYFP